MIKRTLILLIAVSALFVESTQAQIGLIPFQTNPIIESFLSENPHYQWNESGKLHKWGTKDTLSLPFFDDFTTSSIYPDSSKWLNNSVFINNSFPINPPSYGVATFDFLNAIGKPYSPLEPIGIYYADTLTSQAINLGDSAGVPYTAADSIYLSFYYQCRGLGDLITEEDSLRLEFLGADGTWYLIWAKSGNQNLDFIQEIFQLSDANYLHRGFQFRFTNATHLWGNNNHWHIDYVYLNSDRNRDDLTYADVAIQSQPTSLLKNYSSMPYDHFLADPSEAADSIFFSVSNRNAIVKNTLVRHSAVHDGLVLVSTDYNTNAGNVPAQSQVQRKVGGYSFGGLSGIPIIIDRTFEVRESGRVDPVLFQGNDKMEVSQVFERYYAYDDGTAESGFGFIDLKTNDGTILLEFDLKKADTLLAVAIHLTHNIEDVTKQKFDLQVWSDIEFNSGTDELLYEGTWVTDSLRTVETRNGFKMLELTEPIYLPKGKFYVGWRQDRDYNLGVGFDKNNGYLPGGKTTNKKIYYNFGDGWIQNKNQDLTGAPMIRPIVGSSDPWSTEVRNISTDLFKIFPNPTAGQISFSEVVNRLVVTDLNGRAILSKENVDQLNLSSQPSGIYFLEIYHNSGQRSAHRIVKFD